MIKKNGKTYVILEFSDDADAAYFEISFNDQVRNDLHDAAMQGRLADDAFAGHDVVNTNTGDVHGTLSQIGVVHGDITGRRVR